MGSNLILELYKRSKFSGHRFNRIAFETNQIDPISDLPEDFSPIDESYKNFEYFGSFEGRLMLHDLDQLNASDIFSLTPHLEKISQDAIQNDMLYQFSQRMDKLPSKVLVSHLSIKPTMVPDMHPYGDDPLSRQYDHDVANSVSNKSIFQGKIFYHK